MMKTAARPRRLPASGAIRLALALLTVMASSAIGAAVAQSSASYRMDENSFNNGGRPTGEPSAGMEPYIISLDAVGDSISGGTITSAQYSIAGGFGASYPPAGEVHGLRLTDADTLMWLPEPSAWTYNLYRGAIADALSSMYGTCQEQAIGGTSTTDNDPVAMGDGFFYLVSAVNGLAEEGTIGLATSGAERIPTMICP